jgi:hypothetical protein
MNYTILHTTPIVYNIQQNVTDKILIESLKNCYKNTAFSTFPYITHNVNSRDAINNYKSGDCVALSMYVQQHLLKKYNVKSYLIPATIPNKYKYVGYLDISHVALAIPKNKEEIYIVDPAFYFLNPIKININFDAIQIVYAKNIYQIDYAVNLKDYISIEKIESKTILTDEPIVFNEYQTIPTNTLICCCNYINDKKDTWKYILREVSNPDRSITTTFINTRKTPFICSTKLDNNNICTSDIYLKLLNNNTIEYSFNSGLRIKCNINSIPNEIREKLKKYNIDISVLSNIEKPESYIFYD